MKKVLIVVLILLAPGTAVAQQPLLIDGNGGSVATQDNGRQWSLGARGGVFREEGRYTGALLGFEVVIPISSGRMFFNPNLEIAAAHGAFLTVNADFGFVLTPQSTAKLWVGAGVGCFHRDQFLQAGTGGCVGNVLVGVGFGERRVRPYVQAKVAFGQASNGSMVFGLRF